MRSDRTYLGLELLRRLFRRSHRLDNKGSDLDINRLEGFVLKEGAAIIRELGVEQYITLRRYRRIGIIRRVKSNLSMFPGEDD